MSQDICEFYVSEFSLHDTFKYNAKKCCNKYSTLRDTVIKKTEMNAQHNVRSDKKDTFPSDAIMHGQMFEPVSQMIYSQIKGEDILEVGLVKHPSIGFIAASPDGIAVETGTMLEIKCPSKRPVSNVPPLWYWIQMQAQMECCNLTVCDFFDCQFVKYLFDDEWQEDAEKWHKENPESRYHKFGILLEKPNAPMESKYLYAPVSTVTPMQFETWASQEQEQNPVLKRVYYSLAEFHLTPVRKQPKWLEVVLPKIEEAWNLVTFFRAKENAEKYREFITGGKRQMKPRDETKGGATSGMFIQCLC
jgi:putative phage-type endonuclease